MIFLAFAAIIATNGIFLENEEGEVFTFSSPFEKICCIGNCTYPFFFRDLSSCKWLIVEKDIINESEEKTVKGFGQARTIFIKTRFVKRGKDFVDIEKVFPFSKKFENVDQALSFLNVSIKEKKKIKCEGKCVFFFEHPFIFVKGNEIFSSPPCNISLEITENGFFVSSNATLIKLKKTYLPELNISMVDLFPLSEKHYKFFGLDNKPKLLTFFRDNVTLCSILHFSLITCNELSCYSDGIIFPQKRFQGKYVQAKINRESILVYPAFLFLFFVIFLVFSHAQKITIEWKENEEVKEVALKEITKKVERKKAFSQDYLFYLASFVAGERISFLSFISLVGKLKKKGWKFFDGYFAKSRKDAMLEMLKDYLTLMGVPFKEMSDGLLTKEGRLFTLLSILTKRKRITDIYKKITVLVDDGDFLLLRRLERQGLVVSLSVEEVLDELRRKS